MPRTSPSNVQRSLKSLVQELRELRALKSEHEALQKDHRELLSLVDSVARSSRTRGPGRPRSAGPGRKPGRRVRKGGGKRHRSTAAQVEAAYAALASKAGKEWTTKEALCKAAGLKPAAVAAAWKRLMEGFKTSDGKSVKALLESNGSRGLQGRYRKR